MKQIESYFDDFLADIRLTPNQRSDLITGHTTLQERLQKFPGIKDIFVSTFLQGSYKRGTAVRPQAGKRADVDVIIVTTLNKDLVTPHQAIDRFIPFVEEHYKGKYAVQGRSIGIEMSYVDLDIVVTSAPSLVDQKHLRSLSVTTNKSLDELTFGLSDWKMISDWTDPDILQKGLGVQNLSEAQRKEAEWKLEPLHIPDRDAGEWVDTHPLEQIRWTRDKNKNTSGNYINIVKALKWWRTLRLTDIKYPKGYPIEHMIGDCCPDGITSMAEGVCLTLEAIVDRYRANMLLGTVPVLPDRGVPSHNVWKRIGVDEFKKFYGYIVEYAKIAREAVNATKIQDQVSKWQQIFGDKFPDAPDDDGGNKSGGGGPTILGGFTPRKETTQPKQGGRFALWDYGTDG